MSENTQQMDLRRIALLLIPLLLLPLPQAQATSTTWLSLPTMHSEAKYGPGVTGYLTSLYTTIRNGSGYTLLQQFNMASLQWNSLGIVPSEIFWGNNGSIAASAELIYYASATQSSQNLDRFNIYNRTSGTWSSISYASVCVSVCNPDLAYDGNSLYLLPREGTPNVEQYSGGIWYNYYTLPEAVDNTASLVSAPNGLYVFTGTKAWHLAGDTWSQIAAYPENFTAGVDAQAAPSGTLYMIDQAGSGDFYSYTPSLNAWLRLIQAPTGIAPSLYISGSTVYLLQFGNSVDLFKVENPQPYQPLAPPIQPLSLDYIAILIIAIVTVAAMYLISRPSPRPRRN